MRDSTRLDKITNIRTTVRPIRKLFVIDANDINTLLRFIEFCSTDLHGIRNIILLNDDNLFSENTVAFVRRHDPDVILNYSSASEDSLYDQYRTLVRKMRAGDFDLRAYKTQLPLLQRLPSFISNMYRMAGKDLRLDDKVWAVVDEATGESKEGGGEENEPLPSIEELFFSVNAGRVTTKSLEMFKFGIFRDISAEPIKTAEHFIEAVGKTNETLIYLPAPLSGGTIGSSIYAINYNPDDYFYRKSTIVLGKADDLRSVTYFWNERATYTDTESKILWMPIEIVERYKEIIDSYEHYCIFGEGESDTQVFKTIFDRKTQIDCSRYYFPEIHTWTSFSNVQTIYTSGGTLTIRHPAEKLFSNMANYMLEIQGLDEAMWPINRAVGELFLEVPYKQSSGYFVSRISKDGLAISTSHFSLFEDKDLFVEIQVPEERIIFNTYFADYGLEITETRGTKIIDRVINLLGGIKDLGVIIEPDVFELLVRMTPRRIERIVKDLKKEITSDLSEDRIYDLLNKNVADLSMLVSLRAVNAEELHKIVPGKVTDKTRFYARVQELYEKKVLLRGKSFKCPFCEGDLWFPLEAIGESNKCYRCNQQVAIPVYYRGNTLGDAFRLNKLIVNAIDQGVLPVLLTISFLSNQRFYGEKYLYDCEVRLKDGAKLLSEIDIIFTLGRRLGIGEIKADRGFELEQVNRLLDIARRVRADLLLFSTLKSTKSEEVKELQSYLAGQNLEVPALILTRDRLFEDSMVDISKHFKLTGEEDKFTAGPVII